MTKSLPDNLFPERIRNLICAISKAGFFDRSALIGSWLMPIYQELYGIRYVLRTLDIDFAVHIAHTKIASRADLNQCITDLGFVDYFTADGMQRFTGGGYEVEFIGQRAGGRDKGFLSVPEWHLTAMPLPFINILIDYSTTTMLCDFSIRFPVPEAFFLHKLITAQKRLSDNKRMKDIEQCSVIAQIINDDRLQQIIHNQRFSKATKKYIALSCAAIEFPLHRIGM